MRKLIAKIADMPLTLAVFVVLVASMSLLAMAVAHGVAQAQDVYRAGSTYSDRPVGVPVYLVVNVVEADRPPSAMSAPAPPVVPSPQDIRVYVTVSVQAPPPPPQPQTQVLYVQPGYRHGGWR